MIENASFLLSDGNEDENSPRHKLKITLRSHFTFTAFKRYLENEHNSELIELYLLILKYKNIDSKDSRRRFDALKNIFHKYIDPNGKFNVRKKKNSFKNKKFINHFSFYYKQIGISMENVEWFSSHMKPENEISSYENDYINKLVDILYVDLRYSHSRFVEEGD